jgi:hypothetical protein
MAEKGQGLFLGGTEITALQNNKFVFANPFNEAAAWQFRTDANASDLVFATPGNQVSDISMTYAWSDVQADIRGTGSNKSVLTSNLTTSVANNFASDGYTESTEVSSTAAFLNANDSTYVFGADDWTFEAWMNFGTLAAADIDRALFSDYQAGSSANSSLWVRLEDAKLQVIFNSAGGENFYTSTAQTFGTNQWHHIAFTRNGNEVNGYFDGTRVLNAGYSATLNTTTNGKYLMGYYNAGQSTVDVQDYRIYKGYAKYTTASFTPPPSMGLYQ